LIVTTSKPFETVLGYLRGHRTIFLVGCGTCAENCRTGGEGEVQELARRFEAAGKRVLGYTVPDEPCHLGLVKRRLREYRPLVDQADAIVVLACGAGVQAVGQASNMAVYPALDTHFLGTAERLGVIDRTCATCGDCLLGETGAVCPITGCAKSLRHGPCGGVHEGYCEVYPEHPCAWVTIYQRMESLGQTDVLASRSVLSPARPPARPFRRLTVPRHRLR
jgi:ferredoxin